MKLEGKNVCVYVDGGFVMEGIVVKKDPDAIFLEIEEEVYMVFREKVSVIKLVSAEKKSKSSLTPDSDDDTSHPFPENGLSYGETMGSIPLGLLNIDKDSEDSADFSVFFGSDNSKINFSSGDRGEETGERDSES